MADEPSYPKDAPVGDPEAAEKAEGASAAGKDEGRRTKHIVAGAAIGIGSAALVAALLYANRSRRGDKDDKG